ncbi:hypothetical protein KCP77_14495 [Salmonella enterica subsp. enterica]|nr:hypothetical protein KCP77_14495 [Salmonella enterica subsp. enterica]
MLFIFYGSRRDFSQYPVSQRGNAAGFHLITDNGGFPARPVPALVLIQGVVFAFASIELVVPPQSARSTDDGAKNASIA